MIRRGSSARDWVSNLMNNAFERMRFLDEHPQPGQGAARRRPPRSSPASGRRRFGPTTPFAIVRNPWDWQVSLYRFALETVVDLPPRRGVRSWPRARATDLLEAQVVRRLHPLALHRGRPSPDASSSARRTASCSSTTSDATSASSPTSGDLRSDRHRCASSRGSTSRRRRSRTRSTTRRRRSSSSGRRSRRTSSASATSSRAR